MKSEHAENLSLVVDTEKNHVVQHQVAQANKAYRERTTIDSSWFIARAMKFITVVALAAVAYRLLVMWWG